MFQAKKFWNHPKKVAKLFKNTDLVHSNNFWCPPWKLEQPLIYTIYDMSFLEHPEWHKEANRLICFRGVQRASLYADWFIAISQSSRRSFLRLFPHVDPERVRVVYPCSRFNLCKTNTPVKAPRRLTFLQHLPFFLSTGTIEPRKNQQMLLIAYEYFRDHGGQPIPLVFVGGMGWLMTDFHELVKNSKWSEDIYWLGYVSDFELQWLYSNCRVNLYPSFYEGFGLPVLEGMSFAAPIFASSSTSLPEIVLDAGELISPNEPLLWSDKLHEISNDSNYFRELSASALERSKAFSWFKSVSQLQDIYFKALGMDRPKIR